MATNDQSGYNRIVTHYDFDGVISAAICSHALRIDNIHFAAPRMIAEAKVSISGQDVVCDLPYPMECGLWFDHHEGNAEEVTFRGLDLAQITGRFALKDSCARVVYEYFEEQVPLLPHFAEMVNEADVIDSFRYTGIEDWRRETPGKVIDGALKSRLRTDDQRWDVPRRFVFLLRDNPLEAVASSVEVREQYLRFQGEEQAMLVLLEQNIGFLSDDHDRRMMILDLTRHNRQPRLLKQLAFLLHPQSEGIIEIRNLFQSGTKTNTLSFSMSLNLNMKTVQPGKNVGDIMRRLNIGSGHTGAGSGIIHCASKQDMLKRKDQILGQILRLYDHPPISPPAGTD